MPKNFTQEQVEAVKRVRRCKNYYEILGLSKMPVTPISRKPTGNLRWLSTPTRTRRQERRKPSRRSATLTQFSRTRESGGNMISMAAMKNRQRDLLAGVTIA